MLSYFYLTEIEKRHASSQIERAVPSHLRPPARPLDGVRLREIVAAERVTLRRELQSLAADPASANIDPAQNGVAKKIGEAILAASA